MAIVMSLRECINAFHALEKLPKLPNGKISYHLGRVSDLMEQEIRQFEKQRTALLKEHGKDQGNGEVKIADDKVEEVTTRLNEMLEAEVKIDRDPVKIDDVLGNNPDKMPELEPALIRHLTKVIVE